MRDKVDTTLFRREVRKDFIIVQIYVDDVIFGATNESLCNDFSNLMKSEFEMSMMGKIKFFLQLQIKQGRKMEDAKPMKTLMHASNPLRMRRVR